MLNSKYIVEIDGATYHSSPEQVERDRIRDEFSVAHGYSVLRIPASIVFNNPAEAIRRVKDFALNPTRSATEPEPEPVAKNSIIRKPVSNYIGDFTKGVSSFTKIVIDASLKQATISDFKKAIDSEQIFLNA
ncbi:DUF559 domain-containing protein, partial [Pseudomonas helleri]|nr:DUF559 domain-containing protein [Pseudomonas helleri]